MISASEANVIIAKSVHPLGMITLSFERALGHVLTENIIAKENVPSFDNTSMDGYAIRSSDLRNIPVTLVIVDEIAAGAVSKHTVQAGEAIRIMTGAKIPDGADCVMQIEWTKQIDEQHIFIERSINAGHNIRKAGNDITLGSLALPAGTYLRPQEIGVLASLGQRFVSVYKPPVVSILTTGNELIEEGKPLRDGTIRNSNLYILKSLVKESGCDCIDLHTASDTKQELLEKIKQGLKADILITSGGVSAGKYDLIPEVFRELNIEIKFWKVNIKPGMPLLFGMYDKKPVFALPGNPVSTMVTFLQFVRPALLAMKGVPVSPKNLFFSGLKLYATLLEPISKNDGKRHFIRGFVEQRDQTLFVRPTGTQVSNVLTSLSRANCLIIIPEEATSLSAGDPVEIELL